MYKVLIKQKKLFTNINAYVSGDLDKGVFIISGKLNDGVTMKQADDAIEIELQKIKENIVDGDELLKVKNKIESIHEYGEIEILNKATNLATAELMGDASMANEEVEKYLKVTAKDIKKQAKNIFREDNCSTLYYNKKSNKI